MHSRQSRLVSDEHGKEASITLLSGERMVQRRIPQHKRPREPPLLRVEIKCRGLGARFGELSLWQTGATEPGKMVSTETSPNSTAMAADSGCLYIAWKGDGNDNLNVAPVTLSGFTEAAYRNQTNIANFPVNPGDTMSCAVSFIGNTAGVINFVNLTTGQRFSVTLAPPAGATFSGETVEWIMEAPDGGIPTSSLPQFTPLTSSLRSAATRPERWPPTRRTATPWISSAGRRR